VFSALSGILLCLAVRSLRASAAPAAIPDATADRVLGQTMFITNTAGNTTSQLDGPSGVAIAPNGRLFVVDFNNSRILSWSNAASLSNGQAADLIIGMSILSGPESVAVDFANNLYVADTLAHRIYIYSPPYTTPTVSFGQRDPDDNCQTPANNNFCFPRGLAVYNWQNNKAYLYVADTFHGRVLLYESPLTTNTVPEFQITGLNGVRGVAVNQNTGDLFVADSDNDRVVKYNNPIHQDKIIDQTWGASNDGFDCNISLGSPQDQQIVAVANNFACPVDVALDADNTLYVADIFNHRILAFNTVAVSGAGVNEPHPNAAAVFGQPDFTSRQINQGGAPNANTLYNPLGIAFANGSMFVADYLNNRVLIYDASSAIPTPTPPATNTPTNTPLATATNTPLPTATIALPTATPTQVLMPSAGDAYEDDDACERARLITSNSAAQMHTFHDGGDVDWVKFDATKDSKYQVTASIPSGSLADIVLEIYIACASLSDTQAYTFTPGVQIEFTAPDSAPLYLKFSNVDAAIAGATVRYNLTVRTLNTLPAATSSAAIIVAGSLGPLDGVLSNIYHASDAMYQLFVKQGYDPVRINYLAPQKRNVNIDAIANKANLQDAITQWAVSQVGVNGALTIYIIDHGAQDKRIYLDKSINQWISPTELDEWLSSFETARPNAKVNLILEACYAGGFITPSVATSAAISGTVSKDQRVVITSTTDRELAWAMPDGGARFSDYLIEELGRKSSLLNGFKTGQAAAQAFQTQQVAWLDANGNAIPNEPADEVIAAQRGFDIPGSLDPNPEKQAWPPYIKSITTPATITNGEGVLQAEVLDNQAVRHVWAMLYPPTYNVPGSSEALVKDEDDPRIVKLGLTQRSDGTYSVTYPGFTQPGMYRLVLYAEDDEGLQARPLVVEVYTGNRLFLPLVTR
jgi:sugar lactone lactonase YvrE